MKKFLLIGLAVLALCVYSNTFAQQTGEVEVTNCSGDVQVLLKDTEEYTAAEEGMKLQAGDKLKTGENASAELSFNDDNSNIVRLSENTSSEVLLESEQQMELTEGEVFSSISNLPSGSAFEIRTPTAVSGARGTEWVTKITDEGTDVEAVDAVPYVRHYKGEGALSSDMTLIQAGQMTTVRKFQPPSSIRPMMAERKQKFQTLRQDMRRHAGEAVMKRRERQPFDRNQFKEKLKEGREKAKGNAGDNLRPLMSREADQQPPISRNEQDINKPFISGQPGQKRDLQEKPGMGMPERKGGEMMGEKKLPLKGPKEPGMEKIKDKSQGKQNKAQKQEQKNMQKPPAKTSPKGATPPPPGPIQRR